ncbi:MAG: methyl-accepting chemotaxis protein [Geminicoccaceae bacterium]
MLDELARDIALQMASDMDATVVDAELASAHTSTLVNWGVASVVLFVGVLAAFIIGATVNRPIARMTRAMRRLADGDLEVEIEENGRRDELGQMEVTLRIFKDNAVANKRLQDEKLANTEKEELETKARHKRHDELGAEIVTLVEKVTSGDFSERLSSEGRSGILAEICTRINELVDGLDAIVGDVGGKIEALAEGDLDQRVTNDYGGTFGTLSANVNRMADQLAGIVGQIQSATNEVKNAAAEISCGTEDLSNRTEQAASNLEETAASTEEMAATVKQNADRAKDASELAGNANQSAKTGGDVVHQAVVAMDGIDQSAQKITDIISVIDEIAFQTNLLALNASVEAARAGEAGKGFAVVAQEVRQLAQRSAQAAADIKTLIQDSNGQVKEGVELVNRAGEALSEIVGSIGKVAAIVQEIAGASQEQAAGVQEINQAITSMDEMTQQNSALVEQSSAAARSLSDQAGTLTRLMAFFRLGDGEAMPLPGTEPARSNRSARPTRTPALASPADNGWNEF